MNKEKNETRLKRLKQIVSALPEKPGSYQFYDDEGTIIYVGKAKNLKARVSSYFHTEVDRFKTKVLVSKIYDISYTVVNTEEDALLLENMFKGDTSLLTFTAGSNWDVSSVESFASMFQGAENLATLDIRGWNMDATADVSNMFTGAKVVTLQRVIEVGEGISNNSL